MSVNKERPHLIVIPEDDANRQMIEGFRNHLSIDPRKVHVENVACGWTKALETFRDSHVAMMRKYQGQHVLILIDSDERAARIEKAKEDVPTDVADRVFIMGSFSDPEKLAKALNLKKEEVGWALAESCVNGLTGSWEHQLLSHNLGELARMKASICRNLSIE